MEVGEFVISGGLDWKLLLIVKDSTMDAELEMTGGFNEGAVPIVRGREREGGVLGIDSGKAGVLVATVPVAMTGLAEAEVTGVLFIDDLTGGGRTTVGEG